jgi:hypothetical protein
VVDAFEDGGPLGGSDTSWVVGRSHHGGLVALDCLQDTIDRGFCYPILTGQLHLGGSLLDATHDARPLLSWNFPLLDEGAIWEVKEPTTHLFCMPDRPPSDSVFLSQFSQGGSLLYALQERWPLGWWNFPLGVLPAQSGSGPGGRVE